MLFTSHTNQHNFTLNTFHMCTLMDITRICHFCTISDCSSTHFRDKRKLLRTRSLPTKCPPSFHLAPIKTPLQYCWYIALGTRGVMKPNLITKFGPPFCQEKSTRFLGWGHDLSCMKAVMAFWKTICPASWENQRDKTVSIMEGIGSHYCQMTSQ